MPFKLLCLTLLISVCSLHAQERVEQAATAPLNDLNLVKTSIPPVLAQAHKAPYEIPKDVSCPALTVLISELELVLPPDVDAQAAEEKSLAEDAAVAVVQGAVGGIIPFRSWVRRLTGAERRSKAVAAAVSAGAARRAFLKGYAVARSCELPKPVVAACKPVSGSDECPTPAAPPPATPTSFGDHLGQ